jgi:hypothetical protein
MTMYYLPYPCEKLDPSEWLCTPTIVGYHDSPALNGEVYQEEELPTSFHHLV